VIQHSSRVLRGVLLGLATPLLLPTSGSSLPFISEVFYDATGADNGLVFVELYGEPGTLLDGLSLEGINGSNGDVTPSLALAGTIPSDGFFVVADDVGDGTTFVLDADLILNFDFQNGPDSVVLHDAGLVLDSVGYGVFGVSEIFAGEGEPAPDAPAGSSLARVFADLDTDDNLIDFEVLSEPTPGSGVTQVSEPGSTLLVGTALSGLAVMGRVRRSARA
jgi:hypothetical protein